jgi:hypothetical protein
MRPALVLWTLLLVCPVGLAAQRQTEPAFTAGEDTVALVQLKPNTGALLLAGLGGMVVGAFGGGFIGSEIDGDSGLDAAEGAVIGGVIGTSLSIPSAVHLANGSRGNLGRSMLVSTLLGGALLGLGTAVESGELVLAAPVAQLIASVFIERNSSR